MSEHRWKVIRDECLACGVAAEDAHHARRELEPATCHQCGGPMHRTERPLVDVEPLSFRTHTEDEYLGHIDSLRDELLDPVASFEEWDRFKRALVRWMAQVDGEMDETAVEQEHEGEDDEQ